MADRSSKTEATKNSVAIGGDNSGTVVNAPGATFNVNFSAVSARLPSLLADLISVFAQQSLSQYDKGARRVIPPEAELKLKHNRIPVDGPVIGDYWRFSNLLEQCYHGVEQQNPDAHRLVRRRAGVVYHEILQAACDANNIPEDERSTFAVTHSSILIRRVISNLTVDYANAKVEKHQSQELVDLAVTLVVAEAIIECDVMETP